VDRRGEFIRVVVGQGHQQRVAQELRRGEGSVNSGRDHTRIRAPCGTCGA
jgi:hypothetical protein